MLATKPFHGVEVWLRNSKLGKRSYLLSAGPLLNEDKQAVGSVRVKNILAIVQSVAGQTVRASPSLAEFNKTFAGRIKALSIAHDILTQTRWIGIGLNELLSAVLDPYRSPNTARVTFDGPPVLLPARAVLPLSMAIHELATNASKYGALSTATGRVNVTWKVVHNGVSLVQLFWTEIAGPPLRPGENSGFGTTLIRRVITYDLDGRVDLSFAPQGLRAMLGFPLKPDAVSTELPGSATQPD
jgi:two-component sensor histidine kinase